MDAKMTGELISKRRAELGLTQTELAEQLGVTNKAVSRWETGRGYPDIEILPRLASVLGISVQELLEGELRQPEEEDQSLQTVCDYAGNQRRKLNGWRILLIVLILLRVLSWLIPAAVDHYYSIAGSADCVIASDYESLTLWGEEYVALPLNGYECVQGHVIIDEAQVEGAGYLGKFFFGERIYTVLNAPDYELIYLSTEHDVLISDVFVLKTKYDEYVRYLGEAKFDRYYFTCEDSDGYWKEHEMSQELYDLLVETEQLDSQEVYQEGRHIYGRGYVYENDRIFRQLLGEVYLIDGNCYWKPSEYRTDYGSYPQYVIAYYRGIFYPIPDESASYFADYLSQISK